MSDGAGKLYIVGTPIGNLEDITLRALRVLREADVIAAEDTRHTGRLLAHYTISKPLVSYHEFNEAQRTPVLVQRLHEGKRVALVSDAGMPTVSDPGLRLLRAVIAQGLPVEVVPGPSAVTTALVGSGMGTAAFVFRGFLPHKGAQRRRLLTGLSTLPFTIVLYESPHRLVKALQDILTVMGNRQVVVARELTKKFEEYLRGDVQSLIGRLAGRTIKGEITLLIEGQST